MPEHSIIISPRDPILVRDGRPFSTEAGSSAMSLPWPLPSTLAGAIRTYCGNIQQVDWQHDGPQKVLEGIKIAGPLLVVKKNENADWELYFPAPFDAVCIKETDDDERLVRLSPLENYPKGAGSDMPNNLRPLYITVDCKPVSGRNYWSLGEISKWLSGETTKKVDNYIGIAPSETRINVKIDPNSFTSEQGMLFSVSYLSFNDVATADKPQIAMLANIVGDLVPDKITDDFISFGGERRVANISSAADWKKMPTALKDEWKKVNADKRMKIQLATPAIFDNGWLPSWLKDENGTLTGSPDWGKNITLKLISAAVGNYIPVSGWSMDKSSNRKNGPKATRFIVPAGSVYFFEIVAGEMDEKSWQEMWLKSVSDKPTDINDGFGLAVPGVWEYTNEKEVKNGR